MARSLLRYNTYCDWIIDGGDLVHQKRGTKICLGDYPPQSFLF